MRTTKQKCLSPGLYLCVLCSLLSFPLLLPLRICSRISQSLFLHHLSPHQQLFPHLQTVHPSSIWNYLHQSPWPLSSKRVLIWVFLSWSIFLVTHTHQFYLLFLNPLFCSYHYSHPETECSKITSAFLISNPVVLFSLTLILCSFWLFWQVPASSSGYCDCYDPTLAWLSSYK